MGAPLMLSSIRGKSSKAAVAPPPSARPSGSWLRLSSKNNSRLKNAEGADDAVKQKRSMRLNIAPDTESESMQVMLIPESPPTTENKALKNFEEEDRCIYTVGSAEYFVKHSSSKNDNSYDDDDQEKDSKAGTPTNVSGGDGKGEKSCLVKQGNDDSGKQSTNKIDSIIENPSKTNTQMKDSKEVASEGGGSEKKKKSRFGFKKSPKKDKSGGDKERGSSNNNNQDQNGDKNDGHKGNSKDNGKDEKRDSGSNGNNKGPHRPGDSVTFSPERIQFASESTLPIHPGLESTAPTSHPSWTPVNGTEFKVRAGPNYPKNGKKEPSMESLYEVYCVRYFRSEKRTMGGATRIMPLPKMGDQDVIKESVTDGETNGVTKEKNGEGPKGDTLSGNVGNHHPELKNTSIPDVLVVHFMLPYETPNMFKQKEDGPGGECVYYLRPSARFLDEIAGRKPTTPATLLFARWCAECQGDLKMRSRFKCMALVRDIDKHNFGLLKTYNGKPVLITESGRVGSGNQGDVRYLEMTANVHYWAFMAKKGFVSLIPKFANMQMEVGFTIEAHTDAEMPECMLGSTVLSYISESTGPLITPEMQQPVHEHQA